jgi:hypothetical protein
MVPARISDTPFDSTSSPVFTAKEAQHVRPAVRRLNFVQQCDARVAIFRSRTVPSPLSLPEASQRSGRSALSFPAAFRDPTQKCTLKSKRDAAYAASQSSLAGFRIYQVAGLLVFVSTIALLGLMFLLAWSPTLLASFLVAGLVLLLLARSLFFFRVALIVL